VPDDNAELEVIVVALPIPTIVPLSVMVELANCVDAVVQIGTVLLLNDAAFLREIV
jgi:hypothetical protein